MKIFICERAALGSEGNMAGRWCRKSKCPTGIPTDNTRTANTADNTVAGDSGKATDDTVARDDGKATDIVARDDSKATDNTVARDDSKATDIVARDDSKALTRRSYSLQRPVNIHHSQESRNGQKKTLGCSL